MKKTLSLLLATALASMSLVGCASAHGGSASTTAAATTAAEESAETTAETTAADAGASGSSEVEWPTKTVNVIVPAAAGSTLDLTARVFTQYLQDKTGQAFVVTNDTTGNGTVAYNTAMNAEGDGSTLLYTQNLFIQSRGGIWDQDPWQAFKPIADGGQNKEGYIFVVSGNAEYKTFDEFVEYAKANPGKLVAGIQNGGQAHMLQAMLAQEAGIELQMVESGSSGDKITGILGGYIDCAFVSTQAGASYAESGDLTVLCTATKNKSTYNADWPTTAELGYPDVVVLTRTTWFAPASMDDALVEKINETLAGAAEDDTVKASLDKLQEYYEHYSVEETVQLNKESDEAIQKGYEAIK